MGRTKKKQVGTKTRMTLASHQIVLRPLVTEKGMFAANEYNQYSFEVNPLATKIDIRRAVEELFDKRVVSVRTLNRDVEQRLRLRLSLNVPL
jgi:large subunit ribosomal protein L23